MLPEGFSMRKRDKDAASEKSGAPVSCRGIRKEGPRTNYKDEFENDYDFGTSVRKENLRLEGRLFVAPCGLTASGSRRFPGRCPKQRSETP
jgi:hypothetical protein